MSEINTEFGLGTTTLRRLGMQDGRKIAYPSNTQTQFTIASAAFTAGSPGSWSASATNITGGTTIGGYTIGQFYQNIPTQFSLTLTKADSVTPVPQFVFDAIVGYNGVTLKASDAAWSSTSNLTWWYWTIEPYAMLPNSATTSTLMVESGTSYTVPAGAYSAGVWDSIGATQTPGTINGYSILEIYQASGGTQFTVWLTGAYLNKSAFESITSHDNITSLKTADATFSQFASYSNWQWTTSAYAMLPNTAGAKTLKVPEITRISLGTFYGKSADPISGLSLLWQRTFTSLAPSTYTTLSTSTGVQAIKVKLWGGGGGGAGGNSTTAGGGGASGAYVEKSYSTSSAISMTGITVPSAALGGALNSNGNTNTGAGITSLSLSAGGGQGGFANKAVASGGTASGGTVNTNGNSSVLNSSTGKGAPNGGGDQTANAGLGSLPGGGGASGISTGGTGRQGQLVILNYGTATLCKEFGADAIFISDIQSSPGTSSAKIIITTTGLVQSQTQFGGAISMEIPWYGPITTGIGSSWSVRYNWVSGTAITSNAWVALTANKTYSVSCTTSNSNQAAGNTSTFTLSFSSNGGTTVDYTTPNMTIESVMEALGI
jgi:hypothetical protein